MNSHTQPVNEQVIAALRAQHQLGNVLIPDVESIFRKQGYHIMHYDMSAEIGGFLDMQPHIRHLEINRPLSRQRQRYIIAQAIGHILFHNETANPKEVMIPNGAPPISGTDNERRAQQREARAFADALLMPQDLLKQQIAEHQINRMDQSQVAAISRLMGVDCMIIIQRLGQLGLYA